jgi:hypothetical protein
VCRARVVPVRANVCAHVHCFFPGPVRWIVCFAKLFLDAEYTWSQEADERLGTLPACHAHELPFRSLARILKLLKLRSSSFMDHLKFPGHVTLEEQHELRRRCHTFLTVHTQHNTDTSLTHTHGHTRRNTQVLTRLDSGLALF